MEDGLMSRKPLRKKKRMPLKLNGLLIPRKILSCKKRNCLKNFNQLMNFLKIPHIKFSRNKKTIKKRSSFLTLTLRKFLKSV